MMTLLIFNLVLLPGISGGTGQDDRYFGSLTNRLIKDGFDKERIERIYGRPEVFFETKGIAGFLDHREAALNYDQFASEKSIRNALTYMKQQEKSLESAEKEYGVDKEVITAIILVETRFGTLLGRPLVLNTLSSMASLEDPEVRNRFWDSVSKSTQTSRMAFEKWVKRKSTWAYNELKAFLKYTDREDMDPATVPGSYSGALGIAQFMPSNILLFAKDGDGNGSANIFDHADAISSIANYLKHYGWHPGIDGKEAYKVIYHYNHSQQYVDTILKVSKLLTNKT